MPTTQITEAGFETALAECGDAISSGSWSTAWTKLALADVILAGLAVEVGHETDRIRRRESLEKLRGTITAAQGATRGQGDNRRFISTKTGF